MARVITQETFNEAVKENVDILGLSFEEALREAINQFEAQNVDLSNISKQLAGIPIDESIIVDVLRKLDECNKSKNESDIVESLGVIKDQCDKGIGYKVIAGKAGAYEKILICLCDNKGTLTIEMACLKTLLALMTKQPDLLDDKGVEVVLCYLDDKQDSELIKLNLKLAKECCILHEMNRQKLYDANILSKLKVLLEKASSDILQSILALFRALVLDDDVRVEFGKAHEHARGIASETLPHLTNLLSRFKGDESVVNDLILTLSNLLVRNEFCKQVAEAGGLDIISDVMAEYDENEKINRQCFKLLKALAGNDDCKVQIMSKGMAPLITAAMKKNIKSISVSTSGLACIAALCLRCPENSKILFEAEVPEVIIEVMKCYPKDKSIQKTGSWAIRNMVSRSKYQCSHFIELGVEEILVEALKTFKECEYDIKAALRDLGCEVELKEEWTGKGGLLNHIKENKN
ncbi:hypothetical protein WA026_017808 [Henosepilachna vigintioctopunctata]|uniref:Armadillo repeat-containing protein 6 n=1 Tax=Henosepilachna vigintioctopunctata TaxID=420089 RepID=A0AAW1TVG1_9CUCU